MKFKKIILFIALGVSLSALVPADAHMGEETGVFADDNLISAEEFGEIDGIMLKMMNGENLEEAELRQMTEFMNEHQDSSAPSVISAMMGARSNNNFGPHMNGAFYPAIGGFAYFIMLALLVVFLLIGLLLAVFLLKKLKN